MAEKSQYFTPFERSKGNYTASYAECIEFYQKLAFDFPSVVRFTQVGRSDAGHALYLGYVMNGIVQLDDFLNCDNKAMLSSRPILFNNNGHHPGEPEGIDVCMAIVRDFCLIPEYLASLGDVIFFFNPVYNVDGCLMRGSTSRANQIGPESFGKRCNSLNLDQNRDMIKCDSLPSEMMNKFLTAIDPDVMVDTHCSNGADYQYTMTLIHTQTEKLGGDLGKFLKNTMLPHIFAEMETHGWPTCPFVNTITDIPDDGIEDFPDSPRFLSGSAALKHIIGLVPETHMLKPYCDRYASMRVLLDVVIKFTVANGANLKQLRAQERARLLQVVTTKVGEGVPLTWEIDRTQPSSFNFKGYEAVREPSQIGQYSRLRYDRSKPYAKEIAYFHTCKPTIVLPAEDIPVAYLIPHAYTRSIVQRLQWNGVVMHQLTQPYSPANNSGGLIRPRCYQIDEVKTRTSYEGHPFHSDVVVSVMDVDNSHIGGRVANAGDWLVILSEQCDPRYAVETLEPQGADSFFRWGFFNAILEKKEDFSDYVFEDAAMEMLEQEEGLREKFEAWMNANPHLVSSKDAVLKFIFENGKRFAEPEYKRYPVFKLFTLDGVEY